MKKQVIVLLISSVPALAFAQFNEGIGTFKDQEGYSVQRTKVDPGFIAAGRDGLSVFGDREASIVKTKPDGTPQWAMVYGGVGDDSFNSIREIYNHSTLPVDGYAALGTTNSFTKSEDLYFVRTDNSGTPLYSFTFGKREGTESGHCLQYIKDYATGGYGYVMAGQTNSYPYFGSTTDILIIKTDEDGILTKAKVIGAPGDDIAYWIEQTRDGEFVVTGSTTRRPGSDNDIFVIRLDKDLNVVWQFIYRHCEAPFDDTGYGIVENPVDGSFTVTGFTKSFGLEYREDAFLLNLKRDGAVNWMRTYGTTEIEQGASLDLASGGKEYVVSGFAIDKEGNKDAWVFKTDFAGNPVWSNLYGTTADSVEVAAEITDNGLDGYIFTGTAESTFTINEDYYLVNLDHDGKSGLCQKEFTRDWKRHKPCLDANFQGVDVNDLKFACTQYEKADYRVRECSGRLTFGQVEQQSSQEVITVSPNPTSISVQVLFQDKLIKAAGGTLTMFNHSGKIVYKDVVNAEEVSIPLENLPNDVYMVRFISKDGKEYQKKFIKK